MQPSVLLRAMVPSDYDGARALWLSCPGLGLNDVDDSPGGFGRFLARNPRTCFVAETREAIGAQGASPDTLARVSTGAPVGASVAPSADGASTVPSACPRIVGTIMAGHDGRRGYIYHAAVAPGMQGHGIGARLVDAALAALAAEGIAKVALVALASNAAGNAFWEHEGFAARHDIVYRDRVLRPMVRLETTGAGVASAGDGGAAAGTSGTGEAAAVVVPAASAMRGVGAAPDFSAPPRPDCGASSIPVIASGMTSGTVSAVVSSEAASASEYRDAASALLDAAELVGTFAPVTRVGRAANIAAPVARRVMVEAPRIAEKAAPVVSKAAERAPEVTEKAALGLGRGLGKLGRLAKKTVQKTAEEYRRERDS